MEKINPDVNSFMIGSALGDGAFVKKTENHNTYVVFKHSETQIDYLEWKYDFLKKNGLLRENKIIKESKLCGCYKTSNKQFYFSTRTFPELNQYKLASCIELLKRLDEFALAIWVIDDGSVQNGGICKITFANKTDKEKEVAVEVLSKKIGLECYVYDHPTNSTKDYIVIKGKSYNQLKEIVLKNIGDIETVRRKFKW